MNTLLRAPEPKHRWRDGSGVTLQPMATLRLFASAREAAGTSRASFDGTTVEEVLAKAVASFGDGFSQVLPSCRVWVNGDAADASTSVGEADEVAVLPPVSGGAT